MAGYTTRTKFGMSIDNDIYKALDNYSKETMIPKSKICDRAIKEWLERQGVEIKKEDADK